MSFSELLNSQNIQKKLYIITDRNVIVKKYHKNIEKMVEKNENICYYITTSKESQRKKKKLKRNEWQELGRAFGSK